MMINYKKGVSGVVTAVLLILLVIAAIGVFAVVVLNFVGVSTEGVEGSSNCITTTFDIDNVVLAATVPQINITRTGGTSEVTGFRVIVDGTLDGTTPVTAGAFGIGERQELGLNNPTIKGQKVEIAAVFGDNICAPLVSATVQ